MCFNLDASMLVNYILKSVFLFSNNICLLVVLALLTGTPEHQILLARLYITYEYEVLDLFLVLQDHSLRFDWSYAGELRTPTG
ncbi:hypothetical protein ACJX0J_040768, partial [Zea mays]